MQEGGWQPTEKNKRKRTLPVGRKERTEKQRKRREEKKK